VACVDFERMVAIGNQGPSNEGLRSLPIHRRMAKGTAETWDIRESKRWREVMFRGPDAMTKPTFVREARMVFEKRLVSSRELLDLPESPVELVEKISAWGVFEMYWTHNASRQS